MIPKALALCATLVALAGPVSALTLPPEQRTFVLACGDPGGSGLPVFA